MVVRVVGEVTTGRVTVLVPIMTTPELEIIVCPSGSVVVMGAELLEDVIDDELSDDSVDVVVDGVSVNVCPIVVSVVRDVADGSVIVLVPMTTTPELEIIVCPSGSVVVIGRSLDRLVEEESLLVVLSVVVPLLMTVDDDEVDGFDGPEGPLVLVLVVVSAVHVRKTVTDTCFVIKNITVAVFREVMMEFCPQSGIEVAEISAEVFALSQPPFALQIVPEGQHPNMQQIVSTFCIVSVIDIMFG